MFIYSLLLIYQVCWGIYHQKLFNCNIQSQLRTVSVDTVGVLQQQTSPVDQKVFFRTTEMRSIITLFSWRCFFLFFVKLPQSPEKQLLCACYHPRVKSIGRARTWRFGEQLFEYIRGLDLFYLFIKVRISLSLLLRFLKIIFQMYLL